MSSTNSADLPLHLRLGGALRERVTVTVPLLLDEALSACPAPVRRFQRRTQRAGDRAEAGAASYAGD